MAKRKQPPKDFDCPACGERVPGGSKSCPECGACEKSGWSGNTDEDGLGLPDEEFDYDKFVAEEFGGGTPKKGKQRWLPAVALILFLAIALSIVLGWWR
jgi:hypothetical protein